MVDGRNGCPSPLRCDLDGRPSLRADEPLPVVQVDPPIRVAGLTVDHTVQRKRRVIARVDRGRIVAVEPGVRLDDQTCCGAEIMNSDPGGCLSDDVKEACYIQSARIFKRRESPEGVLGFGDFTVRVSRLDPDVESLLRHYVLHALVA